MSRFITLGRGGIIDADRILAITSARSTPIKRLLASANPEQVLNLTYGYPRETVLVMEGGYLVIVSQTVEEFTQILNSQRMNAHEQGVIQRAR